MTKVLIVDDHEDNITITRMILEREQYEILTAQNGRDAITRAQQERPDVVLLDIQMPDIDGFEVCRRLKADPETSHIPVLFLSARHKDIDSVSLGLSLGAEDYIVKPFSSIELRARVSVLARLKRQKDELARKNQELASINRALEHSNERLQSTQKALEQLAITDPLTGLYNRRYFTERMLETFSLIGREPLTVHFLIFDLDHFKQVNDTYGHAMGDMVLIQFSHILRRAVRRHDIIARIGGEEFVVAMLKIPADKAQIAAERIRKEVEDYAFGTAEETLQISTSIGLAGYPDVPLEQPSHEELLQAADAALYYAKTHGRNQVVVAPPPAE